MNQEVINKYLDMLGLQGRGEVIYDDTNNVDKLVINLKNSNEFARTYTLLDNADWLTLDDGDLSIQDERSNLMYINDEVSFNLKANLLEDKYILEIEEL